MHDLNRHQPTYWSCVLVLVVGLLSAEKALAEAKPTLTGRCSSRAGIGILVSPRRPTLRTKVRVLVVSERPRPGARLFVKSPSGVRELKIVMRRGGPPWWWLAKLDQPVVGRYRFALVDGVGKVLACVRRRLEPRLRTVKSGPVWPLRRGWSRTMENLYAAWIEHLFDAPVGARPSWSPLHQVLRDPQRNLLYNYLGGQEDGPKARSAVVAKPDCADLPYFLRAYFAWKLGLPMGYRHCDRGSSKRPSRCGELRTNVGQVGHAAGSLGHAFSQFLRRKVSYVHSGSGRTGAEDEQTDLFPLALKRRTLRPGAVYVDPYGHLLIVAKWVAQRGTKGGLLYAIDGHPDLSVGRKRFWRGAFMFTSKLPGGGFKAFRPLVRRGGAVVPLTNAELKRSVDYRGYFSKEQERISTETFYERMDRVIDPKPLPPVAAYRERLDALYELLQERVDSVKAGEVYMKKQGYRVGKMPRGPRIFETRGPWEDFSTPARDMRLLIAIRDVERFPERVVTQPQRFSRPAGQGPKAAQAAMRALFAKVSKEKRITYVKSDGSQKVLTMADVIARGKGLEVGYNPNDCVELRWGASGDEMSTCKRRAPQEQQQRMRRYRRWFARRERPPLR